MRICAIIFCLLVSTDAWAQSKNKTKQRDTTIYQLLQRIKSQPGTSDPLVMLNDSIYKGDMHLINSKDIISVDVIKGDDAKQIYGPKAQNGVFLMKTKSYLETGAGYTPGIIDLPKKGDGTTQKDTSTKFTFIDNKSLPDTLKPVIVLNGDFYSGDVTKIDSNDIIKVITLTGGVNTKFIVTKKFAISQYQQKFSNLSKDYKIYFSDPKNNDKEFLYVLNGVPVDQTKNDEIKKLYDISPKKIKVVLFKDKGSELGNIKPLVIITTKK